MKTLATADLELFYESLARALDRVGEAGETALLARLALLLAHRLGDGRAAIEAIGLAERGIDAGAITERR